MEGGAGWQSEILKQLRLRRQRESGGFTELILSRKFSNKQPLCPDQGFSSTRKTNNLHHYDVYMYMYCVIHVVDGKLQEQVESLRKEITRLEYQNNELNTVGEWLSNWGGGGEDGVVSRTRLLMATESLESCHI